MGKVEEEGRLSGGGSQKVDAFVNRERRNTEPIVRSGLGESTVKGEKKEEK